MEYRKIIKFGNSSHVISLPKDWLTKHNLVKGNTIYFEENPKNELVLSSKEKGESQERKSITLNIDGMKQKEIEREIIADYIKEFTTITIIGKELTKRSKEVREILHNLVAIEIIEQTNKKIVAKDFLNIREINLVDLLKRLDVIVKGMLTDSKFGKGIEHSEDILNRDVNVNRLTYALLRVIRRGMEDPYAAKRMNLSALELMHLNYVILTIERVADVTKRISRLDDHAKFNKKEQEALNKIHENVEKMYHDAIKSYREKDYDLSCNVFSRNKKIQIMCTQTGLNQNSTTLCSAANLLSDLSNQISRIGEAGFMNAENPKLRTEFEEPEIM